MAAGEETDDLPAVRPFLDATERWRLDCFLEMGFLYDDAVTLAKARVDHWVVERAVKKGCTPKQAVAIFT